MKSTSTPVTAAALRNAAPGEEVGHTGHGPIVKAAAPKRSRKRDPGAIANEPPPMATVRALDVPLYITDPGAVVGPWVYEHGGRRYMIDKPLAPGWKLAVEDGWLLFTPPKNLHPDALVAQQPTWNMLHRNAPLPAAPVIKSNAVPMDAIEAGAEFTFSEPVDASTLRNVITLPTEPGSPMMVHVEGRSMPVVTHLQMDADASPETKAVVADVVRAAYDYVPPKPAASLTELAAPFGGDRRQREVVKKRFATLHGKLSKLPDAERRAFIAYINSIWP